MLFVNYRLSCCSLGNLICSLTMVGLKPGVVSKGWDEDELRQESLWFEVFDAKEKSWNERGTFM